MTSDYYTYLGYFFKGIDDSKYTTTEAMINERTGDHKFYNNEVFNRSVEELAEMTGYSDLLSSWEYTDEERYVVGNPVAKNGPYQVVRNGSEIKIKLYTKINALKKEYSDDPNVKKIKPYENEERGWLDRSVDYREYTFYDFIIAGIQKWEGVYENKYIVTKDNWWEAGTRIYYDYFGLDGAVNVKTEVCSPTEEHPVGNRVYIFDNRAQAVSETLYDEYSDNKFDITDDENWPIVRGEIFTYHWSILNIGTVVLFTKLIRKNTEYSSSYDSKKFVNMIAHEFGHVFGLGDAYEDDNVPGKVGAEISDEISSENMMRVNKEVQSNDIEMILLAWEINKRQYYFNWDTKKKSAVIRLS